MTCFVHPFHEWQRHLPVGRPIFRAPPHDLVKGACGECVFGVGNAVEEVWITFRPAADGGHGAIARFRERCGGLKEDFAEFVFHDAINYMDSSIFSKRDLWIRPNSDILKNMDTANA
ncbi:MULTISPECIES: hypothetical protein [unclassified Rhizobium]|uniref:hypothetical protein n=1 Tax=unclassified Rhizobium TaxID=2613769 RepID=UPI00382E3677